MTRRLKASSRTLQKAEADTRDERAQAKETAKDIGADAAKAAGQVADSAAAAGEEIAERASAIKETVDVKTALMADPSVDATRIDVDADYRTRTVTLNGYVPTNPERDAAESIAKGQGGGLEGRSTTSRSSRAASNSDQSHDGAKTRKQRDLHWCTSPFRGDQFNCRLRPPSCGESAAMASHATGG